MATAAAVQGALAKRWSEVDYENRLVAIACFTIDGNHPSVDENELRRVKEEIRTRGGAWVDVPWSCFLAVFLRLVDAVGWARDVRSRLKERVRIGVNLDEFRVGPDGDPGAGAAFAMRLMEQSELGGICISAVIGDQMTSRISGGDEGRRQEGFIRRLFFAALQLAALLAYFLGFFYLIYWTKLQFAVHGSFPCLPQWLCG